MNTSIYPMADITFPSSPFSVSREKGMNSRVVYSVAKNRFSFSSTNLFFLANSDCKNYMAWNSNEECVYEID